MFSKKLVLPALVFLMLSAFAVAQAEGPKCREPGGPPLCPEEALMLAGGTFFFIIIVGALVIWYLYEKEKEEAARKLKEAQYEPKQGKPAATALPEDLQKELQAAGTPTQQAAQPAQLAPQPVAVPKVAAPAVSAPAVSVPKVEAPPIVQASQPAVQAPAQQPVVLAADLLTQEEEREVQELLKALEPFKAKASKDDVKSVVLEKGYSQRVADEVVKRLYA